MFSKYQFIKEVASMCEDGFDMITLEFYDGETATFGSSKIWVGANYENGWACDLLGNVEYENYEECLVDTADYIYNELGEMIYKIY